jgi:Toprim-like
VTAQPHFSTRRSDSPHSEVDLKDLKSRLDCRDEYQSMAGTGKRSGKALVDHVPWRDDHKPSLNVYADGWVDRATGERGDIFSLVQKLQKVSFSQAVEYVAGRAGGSVAPRQVRIRVNNQHLSITSEPPVLPWQQAALAVVEASERYLWSDRPDALMALAYLRDVRGLSDETIRAARLGYNPRWAKTSWRQADGRYASLAPGIIIPWIVTGALWAVKVRCIVGNLAEALARKPEQLRGEESPKYLNLADGNQAGALYNADAIQPGKPLLIVEGELDVLITDQIAGDLVTAVTVGSASYELGQRWREQVEACSDVFSALDNDEAGQKGTAKLTDLLGSKHSAIKIPAGKDVTDFVMGGGDLLAWLDRAIHAEPAPYWAGVPDTWRAAIAAYLPDSVGPLVELLTEAGLLVPGRSFTVAELVAAGEKLGRGVTEKTIRTALKADQQTFLRILLPIDSDQDKDSEVPIGKMGRNSTPCGSATNADQGGRNPDRYIVLHLVEARDNLLKRAACRIWEHCNPVEKGQPLGKPKAGFFEVLGYTRAKAESIEEELTRLLQPVFQKQGHAERFSERVAKGVFDRLKRSLVDMKSTPLPSEWTYPNASEYRAAYARAIKEAEPARDLSLREWSSTLGVSVRSVSTCLKRAGIACVAQFQERVITSPVEAQEVGYQIKGYPRQVIASAPGEKPREYRYDPERLAEDVAAGYEVVVRYQTANRQVIQTGGQPGRLARPKKAEKPLPHPEAPKPVVEDKSPVPRPEPYLGPGYDPTYVHAWLVHALALAKDYAVDREGRVIDTKTGEVVADGATDQDLLALLRGEKVTEPIGDELIDYLVELGGTVTMMTRANRVEKTGSH